MALPSNIKARYVPNTSFASSGPIQRIPDEAGSFPLYAPPDQQPEVKSGSGTSKRRLHFQGDVVRNLNLTLNPPFTICLACEFRHFETRPYYSQSSTWFGDPRRSRFHVDHLYAGIHPSLSFIHHDQRQNIPYNPSDRIDAYIGDVDTDSFSFEANNTDLVDGASIPNAENIQTFQFGGDHFYGDLYELVVYDRLLSVLDRLSVYNHFKSEYGIDLNPPEADAGRDILADPFDYIVLDGSNSSDPNDLSLSYDWSFVHEKNRPYPPYFNRNRTITSSGSEIIFQPRTIDSYVSKLKVTNSNNVIDTDYIVTDTSADNLVGARRQTNRTPFPPKDIDLPPSTLTPSASLSGVGFTADAAGSYVLKSGVQVRQGDVFTVQYEEPLSSEPNLSRRIFQPQSSTTTFQVGSTIDVGSERVYLNGSILDRGQNQDYTVSADKVILNAPAQSKDTVHVIYEDKPTSESKDTFTVGNPPSYSYQLSSAPSTDSQRVYLNGAFLVPGAGRDYTISGDTVNINQSLNLTAGDELDVYYETSVTNRHYEVKGILNSQFNTYQTSQPAVEGTERLFLNNALLSEGVDYEIQS